MKVLLVNKFLYPKGGAERYLLGLGAQLERRGCAVQYFGMDGAHRCVGNRAECYAPELDFHNSSLLTRLTYPGRVIYSNSARRAFRRVLEDFEPEVIHFNNFNYQLTPSILREADRWRKAQNRRCRLLYTAHDYQMICPNHMLYRPAQRTVCQECQGGHFSACVRHRCIHGSAARSALGAAEAVFWRKLRGYEAFDTVICCSEFLRQQLSSHPALCRKTVLLRNFVPFDAPPALPLAQREGVLYFGRFSAEKGVSTLLEACRRLPDIPFVFAGSGLMETSLAALPNGRRTGFLSGDALIRQIASAKFSVCPSECYDNCPLSVLESLACGVPVVAARIGGIPELVRDGENGLLFESGNAEALAERIRFLWEHPAELARLSAHCTPGTFDSAEQYTQKLLRYYEQ